MLAALFLVIVMAMAAFAVDLGYVMVAKTDLQRAADAAAHAAVLEYRSQESSWIKLYNARSTARQYVADNPIINSSASLDWNFFNADPNGDIVVGKIDFDDPRAAMTFGDVDEYNAIRVRIRRTTDQNGDIPLFFARALGRDSLGLMAEATAAIVQNVGGFKIPPSGENVPLLPITIREEFWDQGIAAAVDDYSFDPTDQTISSGSDDVPEVVLFPNDTGSSGNFGTVNIGISANSTSHLGKQIRHGVTQADLDFHGGELALDSNGELLLSGDPGLSASVKGDLQSIAGKPVVIPIYRDVVGNGNGADFTIVKFVAVRIMAVQLTSGTKFVSVQPANVTFKGTVQSTPGLEGTSEGVYSPPVVVQ